MKYLILVTILALPVSAQVYKCEENGTVTYSQTPCAHDAEVTEYSRESEDIAPTMQISANSAVANASATMDRIGSSVKKRDVTEKINRLERQVARQIRERDTEIAKIVNRKGRVVRNLAGNVYEDSLNSDILAVTTLWNTRIDATNRELDQLRAEYNKL